MTNTETIAAFIASNTRLRHSGLPNPLARIQAHEAAPACPDCNGEGRTPNGSCTGDTAGGWADTCDTCGGSGKDLRGCDDCGTAHHIQDCSAIRKELFK